LDAKPTLEQNRGQIVALHAAPTARHPLLRTLADLCEPKATKCQSQTTRIRKLSDGNDVAPTKRLSVPGRDTVRHATGTLAGGPIETHPEKQRRPGPFVLGAGSEIRHRSRDDSMISLVSRYKRGSMESSSTYSASGEW